MNHTAVKTHNIALPYCHFKLNSIKTSKCIQTNAFAFHWGEQKMRKRVRKKTTSNKIPYEYYLLLCHSTNAITMWIFSFAVLFISFWWFALFALHHWETESLMLMLIYHSYLTLMYTKAYKEKKSEQSTLLNPLHHQNEKERERERKKQLFE